MPSRQRNERQRRRTRTESEESSLGPPQSEASDGVDQFFVVPNSEKSKIYETPKKNYRACQISSDNLSPVPKKRRTFDFSSLSNAILLPGNQYENIMFATEKNPQCQIWRKAGLNLYQNDADKSGQRQIEINWNDLSQWLNDSFIYAFICYLASVSPRKAIVVDSLFTDLCQIRTLRASALRKSVFNFDVDVPPEIILMPLIFPGHWTLLIHDLLHGTFFVDSLQISSLPTDRFERIKNIISEFASIPNNDLVIHNVPSTELTMQQDGCSCGYFVCLFAESWIFNNRSFILPNLDINLEKRRILWHINSLYSRDDVPYRPRNIPQFPSNQEKRVVSANDSVDCSNSSAAFVDLSRTDSNNYCIDENSRASSTNEGPIFEIPICETPKSRGGRPKKILRGPGRPSRSGDSSTQFSTPSSVISIEKQKQTSNQKLERLNYKSIESSPISTHINDQSNRTNKSNYDEPSNLPFTNDHLEFPYGPIVSPDDKIIRVSASKNFISHLWANPDELCSEDLIYTFLQYVSTMITHKRVVVLSPQYTNLEIHFGSFPIEFNAIDVCFNYTPDYDVLLFTVYFPGHFALIIFDRTDRTNLKCLYIDPLPDIDRLNDITYAHYDPRRIQLITNAICDLTPGLNSNDFELITLSSEEYSRQIDGVNCGFFVCLYAESYLLNNGSLILPNLYINEERRRILWHIAQLLISNEITYISRSSFGTNLDTPVLPLYTTEAIIDGECPRDEKGTFVCVEPTPIRDPEVLISPARRSLRISSRATTPNDFESDSCTEIPAEKDTISRRCHIRHDGLPCADVRAKHTTVFYDSGIIGEVSCNYCNALLLKSESEIKNGKTSSSFCCLHGTVQLPPYNEYPPLLKKYLLGDSSEAKEFLSNQNLYNSLLAFASVSVGFKESSLDGNVCFLLNGEFFRRIGSIFPGKFAPSFTQLYILDPNAALEHRAQNISYGGDRVNPETLKKLDLMIRENHPIAKELLNFHSQYLNTLNEKGIDAVKNFRLTLIDAREAPIHVKDPSLHSRQTNLPDEGDSLFAVWTESDQPPVLKGIWITTEEGKLRQLPAFHPLTDSLCYPLLFPLGDDGYHRKISRKQSASFNNDETRMEIDIVEDNQSASLSENDSPVSEAESDQQDNSKEKFLSIRNYIRYRMAIRNEEIIHHIWSAGGGLSQKFILDYASRIDTDVSNFLRKPELNLRSTLPENILKWLARNAGLNSADELGSIVMFRKNQPGTRAGTN